MDWTASPQMCLWRTPTTWCSRTTWCFEDDVSSADDFVVFVPDESLLPDDDVLVCVSLSDDVPVPAFEVEDFEADEPDPVELLLDDDDPESPLDEAPDPESSACATPVPVASATPSVTAPTPSHL